MDKHKQELIARIAAELNKSIKESFKIVKYRNNRKGRALLKIRTKHAMLKFHQSVIDSYESNPYVVKAEWDKTDKSKLNIQVCSNRTYIRFDGFIFDNNLNSVECTEEQFNNLPTQEELDKDWSEQINKIGE